MIVADPITLIDAGAFYFYCLAAGWGSLFILWLAMSIVNIVY